MQAGFFFLAALHLPLVAGLLTPVSTVPPASLHQQYPLSSPAGESLRINGLSENGWEKLVEAGELQQFGPNERIIEEGTLPESRDVYLFLAGEGAWFLVGGRRVAPWEVGAFAGEASFVSGCFGPRSASLVSTSNVACLRWETTKLRRLLDAEPEIEKPLKNFWLLSMAKKLQGALAVTEREATASSRTDGRSVDYGYRPVAVGLEEANKATPVSAFQLALWNFNREYRALRRSFRYDEFSKSPIVGPLFAFIDRSLEKLVIFPEIRPSAASTAAEYDPAVKALREKLAQLTLSNERIAVRERVRMKATRDYVSKSSRSGLAIAQKIDAASTPWFVMIPYVILCWLLDVWFDGRPIARFYLLETVARMPYFSYLSMYHLYETLGWWTVGHEVRRVHAAEEWNESQHLRIMESLGGDSRWADRFLSRHAAVVYYWILNVTFFVSPQLAYNFSELVCCAANAAPLYVAKPGLMHRLSRWLRLNLMRWTHIHSL
jgi:CRP-like cAMP-binding protein